MGPNRLARYESRQDMVVRQQELTSTEARQARARLASGSQSSTSMQPTPSLQLAKSSHSGQL